MTGLRGYARDIYPPDLATAEIGLTVAVCQAGKEEKSSISAFNFLVEV